MGCKQSTQNVPKKDPYAIPTPKFEPAPKPTPQSSSEPGSFSQPRSPASLPSTTTAPPKISDFAKPRTRPSRHLPDPDTQPEVIQSKPTPHQIDATDYGMKKPPPSQPDDHGLEVTYSEYVRSAPRPPSPTHETSKPKKKEKKHKHKKRHSHERRSSNQREEQVVTSVKESNSDYSVSYKKGKQLGVGAFATVFIGTSKMDGKEYAIKCVDRSKMSWGGRDALLDEISSLKELRGGPNIVQLYEIFTPNQRTCYLVMELLQGGELFDCILKKRTFTEKEARLVIRGLLNALDFMHERRIAHRDLKPENLLLVSKDSDTDIKLADMGFAKKLQTHNACRTLCGTPGYLAPEILERFPSYDVACDMFSVGVILFVLLGGYLPFDDENEDLVFERTRNADYKFYPDYWRNVSESAKNLVVSLLTLNPSKRTTAKQALQHEWMTVQDVALPKKRLSIVSQPDVKNTSDLKLRHTSTATYAATDRMQHLNNAFNSYITKCDDDTATVFTMTTAPRPAPPKPDSAKGLPFKKFYKTGEKLGEGGFGVVKRAEHLKTKESRAVKIVDKVALEEHAKEALEHEIAALKLLRGGPHIIRLIDVFEEPRYTYIIMEEMNGGELLKRIVDKEVYTEREARSVCKMLFSAIDYCHKKKIAHRDLKPENLLLAEKDDDTSIKVCDFGFAKRVKKPNSLSTLCGTASYVAPEVLDLTSKGYDERCDVWSCGVIVYVLLGGYAPFDGPVDQLANLILRGEFEFHDKYWRYTSQSAKDLISSCLQVDPDRRITAEDALSSDWMTVEEETLTGNDLSSAKQQIKNMLPVEKLKGAVHAVMLANQVASSGSLADANASLDASPAAATAAAAARRAPSTERPATRPGAVSVSSAEDPAAGKLFYEIYDLGAALGSGSFSVVHEAVNKRSTEEVAVKVVDRRQLHPADAVALQDEIVALKEVVACPHIVELYEVFEEPDTTFLVMEKMLGGDLIQQIISKSHYKEADAKAVCHNLLLGIQYCHNRSIAIRNIKPENLLLSSPGDDTNVKLSDFGYAKKVLYPNSLRTQCGTEGYTAPEILSHRPEYDVPCDMWSLGVVMYILIGGYRPFRGTGTEIIRQIRYGEYEFHDQYWRHVSREAKDLIRRMMTVDPNERISASEALQSEWMMADDSTLLSDLDGNRSNLTTFKGKAKIRQVGQMMVAMNKLQVLSESYSNPDDFSIYA